MNRSHRIAAVIVLGSAGLGACATKSDIQQLQDQFHADIAMSKAELGRRDSVRAAQLGEVIRMQRVMLDSLLSTTRAVGRLRGDLSGDLYNLQQQLVQVQELTGQSQRRLSELRTQLEAREAQAQIQAPLPSDTTTVVPSGAGSADQMYEASLAQLRGGRTATARVGLQEMLRTYPASERAPDALYFVGQSFAADMPDSAAAYYQQVVDRYSTSPRAAAALYNLGLLAERRKDSTKAREVYQRLVTEYPKSTEADLARDKLKTPKP